MPGTRKRSIPRGHQIISTNQYLAKYGSNMNTDTKVDVLQEICEAVPLHNGVNIPCNNFLTGEVIHVGFCTIATMFQFVNLYQTGWWATSNDIDSMNWTLINGQVVKFILLMVAKTLSMYIVQWIVKFHRGYHHNYATSLLRMLAFGIWCIAVALTVYQIWSEISLTMILLLFLPWIINVVLYINEIPQSEFDFITIPEGKSMHYCSASPFAIRNEVNHLQKDFNLRMQYILFNTFSNAYYCGYIPLCFSQKYLFFEYDRLILFIFLLWGCCFLICLVHYFPLRYLDICHRTALHLGLWSCSYDKTDQSWVPWLENEVWFQGTLVKFGEKIYRAEGIVNGAEPGNRFHMVFYHYFGKPLGILYLFLIFNFMMAAFLATTVYYSVKWNHTAFSFFLMFAVYYSMFNFLRDYFITKVLYKMEA